MQTLSVPTSLAAIDTFKETIQETATSGGRLHLEPGLYNVEIDLPNGSKGLTLIGAGKERTYLRSSIKNKPVIKANGLWYSRFEGINFGASEANETSAVVDIDGAANGVGHGVQGNSFYDCTFDGRGAATGEMSNYAFAMVRTAQGYGQGSENMFVNCHFIGAKKACVYIIGHNALNNQFIGGNCQLYERCGLEMMFGSFHVFGMGFQSTSGVRQIANDGWDIKADGGGVGDSLSINGCRTESLRFFRGNGAQPPMITNCNQRVSLPYWYSAGSYPKGYAVIYEDQVYVSKHETLDVEWNPNNWERVEFLVVDTLASVLINNNWHIGDVFQHHDLEHPVAQVMSKYDETTTYKATRNDRVITVDASKGPVVVQLHNPGALPMGREIVVVRLDRPDPGAKEHKVQVTSEQFNNQWLFSMQLPVSRRSMRFMAVGGGSVPRRYYHIGGFPTPARFVD